MLTVRCLGSDCRFISEIPELGRGVVFACTQICRGGRNERELIPATCEQLLTANQSFGVSILTVEHVQCWSLLSQYETQKMCFPRAFMSVGRSARLAQMLGLHQVDKENKSAKQILPPARDQIDVEIRRRAFWSAFLVDRWATSGTGWPVIIDVREVRISTTFDLTGWVANPA